MFLYYGTTMLELIALNKENFDAIKKEMKYICLLFLSAIAIFKIAFFKEDLIVIARVVSSLFWLFVLPGYAIMVYWKENLGFTERVIIGVALSAGIIGILSYYMGLIGLNIRYHAIVLPLALIATGIFIVIKKRA